jgi:hypothetical protein
MRQQPDFAESMMNSATSSAADPITTNTFQQPADAVTFSGTPASQWASCRSRNKKVRAARRVANGARRDRTVDRAGRTVDFRLSARRDVAAAKAFFRKAVKSQQRLPQTITLDGYAASHRAVRELKADGSLPTDTKLHPESSSLD